MNKFQELIEIMKKLRKDCPWDKEQTLDSLKPYLLEESYELIDAIDKKDYNELKSELGDLLLQVVFQSEIMEEEKRFNIDDVIEKLNEKLIRRHPHVFKDVEVENSDEVLKNWEEIKKTEKEHLDRVSVLDGIPNSLPPLIRATKLQKKVKKIGFEFEKIDDVIEKIDEEVLEFKEAIKNKDIKNLEEELGDIIFTLVNISRFLKIDITNALIKTNRKFEERFRFVEKNLDLKNSTLEEMDKMWEEAKKKI
ncbi:XTP/dITP diphosphohydrolase/tetrapyrrole methylase family protein/MazG family protein [Hypnocyclicus thermotrophus]|uniref:XTP/dITP diphosphohydrolase/tetrapyrrole methylase family protein/MazG family protein n=1 Tax=Hypnocyclicus thermotrophus TaxID=1627895 RepID=A0AA46I5I2_9FUSO|nr:nucleoside triphosphate pyrophosphohydrolase [Hypnocyclicus thermotrophus]TDT69840.1 XTP/dITP diphosphohydrolase/tetrapyrrole methylase family protein/MazG family protein [Hypnocyclicus thermotrophus]